MSKAMGWVLLYRSLQEHWLWDRKPFSDGQAWIDLIMLANHEEHNFVYKGQQMVAKRGQLNRSISSLAERWGWSKSKATRFFNDLKADGMVTVESDHNRTTITIENYTTMQDAWRTSGSRTVNERNTDETRAVHERNHTNNEKNVKNEKKKEEGTPIPLRNVIPPTLEMVRQYCDERHSNVDPDYFYDYYESRNWMLGKTKMKDWQASFRTWEKKNFDKQKKQHGKGLSWLDGIDWSDVE